MRWPWQRRRDPSPGEAEARRYLDYVRSQRDRVDALAAQLVGDADAEDFAEAFQRALRGDRD